MGHPKKKGIEYRPNGDTLFREIQLSRRSEKVNKGRAFDESGFL